MSDMMPADTITHNAVILDGDPTEPASDGSIAGRPYSTATGDDWIASAEGTVIARGRGTGWKDLSTSATVQIIDAEGAYLAPAYVDIHCHGAGGSSAEDGESGLAEVLAVHRRHGTRALALSYVSDTVAGLCRSLSTGVRLCPRQLLVCSVSMPKGRSCLRTSRARTHPKCSLPPPPRRSNRSSPPPMGHWPRSRSPQNCRERSTRSHGSPRRG